MLFNSLEFLVFFPIFLLVYFTTKGNVRTAFCLVSSYLFYGWWDWRFLGLILLLTTINFYLGIIISKTDSDAQRKRSLFVSCFCSLAILGFFKYFNFFLDSLAEGINKLGIEWNFGTLSIILPVGISFYTFQTMSYTIDLYRRKIEVENSFLKFATFVAFFPQLVAGPIVRASTFIPQLYHDHKFDWKRFGDGMCIILWGFVMKSAVADSLALVADSRFAQPYLYSSLSLLIGVIFYSFQIYGDFCGYSLIAIGIGRILGYDFGINFNRPYFAISFSDFWQRWHISLSSWLRDYLYIPLGGNRHGRIRTHINLLTTMLLGGLWHGANWTFVIWGGLHGMYLILQRIIGPFYNSAINILKIPKALSHLFLIFTIFTLTSFAWIFFRATSLSDAIYIITEIISFEDMRFSSVNNKFQVGKGLILITMLFLCEAISFSKPFPHIKDHCPWLKPFFIVVCLLTLSLFGTFGNNAFIYFQF